MKNITNSKSILSKEMLSLTDINPMTQDFPLDVFPIALQQIIKNVSKGRGIHKDYLASATLLSFAFSIGNSFSVSVLENTTNLKPILYMVLIGSPGSNKSSALKFVMRWFYAKDKELFSEYKRDLEAYEAWLELDSKERALCPRITPVRVQSILKDSTLEAIGSALGKNPRGVAQIRDEIAGFFRDLNKYRSGSDLENYLEMWSQDPVILNRVSKELTPVLYPFLILAGTTQPKVFEQALNSIFSNGQGFFDRFLFVWPEITEKAIYQRVDIKDEIKNFEDKIEKIYLLSAENSNSPRNFSFSPEAEELILEWLNVYNKNLVDQSDSELASIYAKYDIHLQRTCLILHFISWAFDGEELEDISFKTTSKAIRLIEYFRRQSEKALDYLISADPLSKLNAKHVELYTKLPDHFKTAEGKCIAEKLEISERSFYYFLSNNPRLFMQIKQGLYEKK